jgi:potassium efflux system protein
LALSFPGNAYGRHDKDTVHFKPAVAEKKTIVLSDSALNEIGLDSLLNKIQNVHLTLDQINNTNSIGFDIKEIEQNFAEIDSNVDNINENLTLYNSVLDVKNLQMFDILLKDMQGQVLEWRTTLSKYNKELSDMSAQMVVFKKDTLLKSLLADSSFRSLYLAEINDLKSKWKTAKQSISYNQSHIKEWLAIITNEYFETIDLQNKMNAMLRKVSVRSLGKEYDFLWNINSNTLGQSKEADQLVRRSYLGQTKILVYYFSRNWGDQFFMLLCGLLFGVWVFFNFFRLHKSGKITTDTTHHFSFINQISILPALIVVFNIAPFFDLHPPTAYVAITEFLLVIALTILLKRNWPKQLFSYWLIIAGFYLAFTLTGALLTPTFTSRVLLLSLNSASVIFGILWYRKLLKHTLIFSLFIRLASIIYVALNLAAIFCNIFGRLSLAKIFSVTAVYGLTQIIGLIVFIQVVLEAFHLQTLVNQLKGGWAAKLNFHRTQQLLTRVLMGVSVCVWVIVFSINLNIYNVVFNGVVTFLEKPRVIGNTSFEIKSILLFVSIIYISNLLQQGIGSLYGKSEGAWDPQVKKNGSRLAMTRLVLIVLGFLIAVAASGLPMDKITIVLGALGVGIGLGLQGIVNNLVSGVILIFEQPFRIGDYIQLGDKKGRVLDIGIRSSKLLLEEGAELIMPNADLLSGMVINWTTRNDNVRIDMPVNVQAGHSFDEIKKIILEEIMNNKDVLGVPAPEILLTSQTEKGLNLKVLLWISDVHQLQPIKSELLNSIYSGLAKQEIKIV